MDFQDFANNPKKSRAVVITAIIIVFGIILLAKSSVTIKAGQAGVLFKTFAKGVVTDKTFSEGFHVIAPWNKIVVFEVRQQEILEKMAVLSSNGLDIIVEASVWYQPVYQNLGFLYQQKGLQYAENVCKPVIRSVTRSVIGRYTPDEIYSSKRDIIQTEIYEETKKVLETQFVQLNEVLVRDITLPPKIKTAIENKLAEEQLSKAYQYKISREEQEKERIKINAEGKAEANRILNASLTDNILKEKGIEATLELAKSSNTKVVVIGNSDGLPLILGDK
ncbi:prohibitin family protein [Bacteroidota bacterium]